MKKLNRLLSRHQILHIPEDELKETFIRGTLSPRTHSTKWLMSWTGRGPGGQAINKTSSCVSLIHLPTGVRVQAQPTRSREQNRTAARHILREKLDSLRVSGAIPGGVTSSEVSPTPDQGGMVSPREEKKAAEKNLAAVYAKDELKAAKVRLRKANRARKHKKKKRAMEGDKEADEGGVDDGV